MAFSREAVRETAINTLIRVTQVGTQPDKIAAAAELLRHVENEEANQYWREQETKNSGTKS